jgi:hypothetical protein
MTEKQIAYLESLKDSASSATLALYAKKYGTDDYSTLNNAEVSSRIHALRDGSNLFAAFTGEEALQIKLTVMWHERDFNYDIESDLEKYEVEMREWDMDDPLLGSKFLTDDEVRAAVDSRRRLLTRDAETLVNYGLRVAS